MRFIIRVMWGGMKKKKTKHYIGHEKEKKDIYHKRERELRELILNHYMFIKFVFFKFRLQCRPLHEFKNKI